MTSMAMYPTLLRSTPEPKPTNTSIVLENIRIALIWNGMRRKELASILGVSYGTACRMWNRRGGLLIDQLHRVARAVNVPPSEFLTDHGKDHDWVWIKDRTDQ